MSLGDFGKGFILFGVILIATGLAFQFVGKVPGIGRLPGDLYVKKGPVTFYFPLVTCLVVSLILTLLLSLFGKK